MCVFRGMANVANPLLASALANIMYLAKLINTHIHTYHVYVIHMHTGILANTNAKSIIVYKCSESTSVHTPMYLYSLYMLYL